MTTTHETLTDRYVAAALRGVRDDQRADVAAELRGSIADAIDARIERGETADVAEREVLTGLGDPMRLASEYSERPLYLIGPSFYPDYIRLLRLLVAIVVPIIAIVVGTATAVSGADVLRVATSALGAAFSVGVQLAFWVTVVFALIDRSGAEPRDRTSSWDLSDLPELPDRRVGLGETVASISGLVVVIWLLVWQPGYQETFSADGPSIPILDPSLSSFWVPFLVAVLLASVVLEVVKYRVGRWTIPIAAVNTALSLAFAVPAIWLATTGRLLNPEFMSAVATGEFAGLVDAIPTMIAWIIGVIAVVDISEGWWKAYHSS